MPAIRFSISVLLVSVALVLLAAAAGNDRIAIGAQVRPQQADEDGRSGDDASQVDTSENEHSAEAQGDGGPQRVIGRVGRDRDIRGFLELEDKEVIVIRTLEGEK